MNENSSRKSSKRSMKSNSNEFMSKAKRNRNTHKFTCKALFIGLMLMFIGGSMATLGYFVDHIYTPTDTIGNDTIIAREKSRITIISISTYVGPMIMGVGGFIVVAACVMTFEQRDNAAKVITIRPQLNSTRGHSINRHNKPSPNSRQPLREGSSKRYNTGTNFVNDPLEEFSRRDLTADFIQFSRNLQQANIEKHLTQQVMGRCPSAPNLAGSDLYPRNKKSFFKHTKHSRNSLHPLIGQSFLTPHILQRQALSMDNPEYYSYNLSAPCSKGTSRQSSYSTGKGSAESLEAESSRKAHSSQASMMLDLHMPNDCPVSLRIRDRNKRSDTARKHLLIRQAQIENEEDSVDKDSRCGSPQFVGKFVYKDEGSCSSSTVHSRRESYSPRMLSIDDSSYQHRFKFNDNLIRNYSSTLQCRRSNYLRSNTVCNETSCRRGSNTFESNYRKSSADYNFKVRRKSSNTSDSIRYCLKMNVDDPKYRKEYKSPTSSLKSFQELRYITQKFNEQEIKTERMRKINRKCKESNNTASQTSTEVRVKNQSLSPDSISVSSSTTEGHSKTDFTSVEVESIEDEKKEIIETKTN